MNEQHLLKYTLQKYSVNSQQKSSIVISFRWRMCTFAWSTDASLVVDKLTQLRLLTRLLVLAVIARRTTKCVTILCHCCTSM